ncbi:DEAD/DEAH box helicase family protein [Micrococcus porci]|uniref:DEAD/DEAH box helicase family protein n=1 Tax=Micrococcus porci TaxID=2856555 RepID=UPI003CF08DCC
MSANIQYDEHLIEDIASRFDLRTPNRDALAALVQALADGDGFQEVVADLATGVGKTFLMAALVDYLALQGVRDFLIVTPGSTIQRKTLENFDQASAKYVPGAEATPFVITPENFRTGAVATALRDPRRVKVFVFNVQQLLAPTATASRRTRAEDENLGGPLYEHLQNTEDLVVIADEHHVYRQNAKKFSAAIRDLTPRALVGLTATPDEADHSKIVFQYTLGEAIADEFVKVPVIVYRPKGTKDEHTQLRDACALLEIKERAYADYVAAEPEATPVKPVLFVVCQDIDHAGEVGAILAKGGFIGDGSAVLEITSQSSDEALEALAAVEEPGSPIRAIVSVNMLREGWDVKNIAVIVALRRLASQTLTEQILGRGLRLPFKRRTGRPMIDQVDLVAHDSYQALLKQKNVLHERIQVPTRPEATDDQGFAPAPAGVDATGEAGGEFGTDAEPNASGPAVPPVQPKVQGGDGVMDVEETATADGHTQAGLTLSATNREGEKVDVLHASNLEERKAAPQYVQVTRINGAPQIVFPRREVRPREEEFNLSDISDQDARQAGARHTTEVAETLQREAIVAKRAGADITIGSRVEDSQEVTPLLESLEDTRLALVKAIMGQREVPRERRAANAADRLAAAFLEGAGVTDQETAKGWSAARRSRAVDAMATLIRQHITNRTGRNTYEFVSVTLPVEPVGAPVDLADGLDTSVLFQKGFTYGHWRKNIMPVATFDAGTTEFALARLLERDPAVKFWLRLYTNGEAYIQTARGRYFPDFIVIDRNDVHWVVEAKSDRDATEADVLRKKEAAEEWARAVRDEGDYGDWRYMFATETHIANAEGWSTLLTATAPHG